jgi:hypothetical protein
LDDDDVSDVAELRRESSLVAISKLSSVAADSVIVGKHSTIEVVGCVE